MDEFDLGPEWDLGEVLAERDQPTDTVEIYLNEKLSYAKGELVKLHSRAKSEDVDLLDQKLAEIDVELDKSKYVIELTAVPSRMREDISSKALAHLPIQPDLLGRDNHVNALARQRYENILVWNAQIKNVVNPQGRSKRSWSFEEMEKFYTALPTAVQNVVSESINTLSQAAEEYTVRSKSVDF